MANTKLARLKEAARRKKEKAAGKEAPEKKEAPRAPEAPKTAPRKEAPPARKEPPRAEPPPKKAEPAPKPKKPAGDVESEVEAAFAEPVEAPKKRPEPAPRPKRAPEPEVEEEVEAAFAEPEEEPKKPARKEGKEVPKGPGPPSFEIDPSKIRRDPSPGKYGKLIDLIREDEKLKSSQDVYAVLFACIRRYSEIEGKSKSVRDVVDEETKRYLQSRKASPA